jgi:hypothetical protein
MPVTELQLATQSNYGPLVLQQNGSALMLRQIVNLASDFLTITDNPAEYRSDIALGANPVFSGSITDGGSVSGAAAWKHGPARTGTGLLASTTTGLQVQVGSSTYTLAVLTTNP